jgi:hypothetical protein
MKSKTATALVFMLLLAGCSDSVTLISQDKIAEFKPGTTSQAEIAAALGKPIHTMVEADGTKIDQYPFDNGKGGGSMMPSFLGGSSTPDSYGMVTFTYTTTGILKTVDTGK